MCGIFAIKGKNAVKDVYNGLSKLEYRGYDSCGIALISRKKIDVYKKVGYIENLKATGVLDIDSSMAIGHTRWATNGGVTLENSHPHLSPNGKFAVVHNGILENYSELKDKYLNKTIFNSETDTEIIVQLMELFYNGQSVWEVFKQVVSLLKGSFAIVVLSSIDGKVYFARHISPLVIAKSGTKIMLSSDINGFEDKKKVYYVDEDSIGYIDRNVNLFNLKFNKIKPKWVDYSVDSEGISKGEFAHFMNKEIYDIPRALKKSYNTFISSKFILPRVIENVLIIGCGTSYHSGLMGGKYIEKYAGIKTECLIASEFIYNDYIRSDDTLAVFISQSGETADTLTALKKAKEMGLYTLAITNVLGSTITRVADSYIYENVGAEICVASTKAYTSQVFLLIMLSNVLYNNVKGNYSGLLGNDNLVVYDNDETINYLGATEEDFEELFNIDTQEIERQIDNIIDVVSGQNQMYLIGKDFDYVTAMEGSLKIKEVSYIFTDAYPCGELKHGTLALIENGSKVISIITSERLCDKCLNSMHEIVARGGECVVISNLCDARLSENYKVIEVPNLVEIFMPIVSIIPLDLLAYKLSISKGYNPDKPRNLAKSVTVE